ERAGGSIGHVPQLFGRTLDSALGPGADLRTGGEHPGGGGSGHPRELGHFLEGWVRPVLWERSHASLVQGFEPIVNSKKRALSQLGRASATRTGAMMAAPFLWARSGRSNSRVDLAAAT